MTTVSDDVPVVFVIIKRDVGRETVRWMALSQDGVRVDRPVLRIMERYARAGSLDEARSASGLSLNRFAYEIYAAHFPDRFRLVEVSADYPVTGAMRELLHAALAARALLRDR